MIQGSYYYNGIIPCVTCKWLDPKEDNFEPIAVLTTTAPDSEDRGSMSNDDIKAIQEWQEIYGAG